MALGMQVGLGPGHIVQDGNPAPQKGGRVPQFSADSYCGQTAGCIKMPLGVEVGLSPGDFMLDGDPAPNFRFGPCLLWPNGWMDQDATWYRGRPQPRPHCITCRWDPAASPPKGAQQPPPSFWPMSIVAKGSSISATAEQL